MFFDSEQGTFILRHKVEVLYSEESKNEVFFQFQWPRWAIDEANKLVIIHKLSFNRAIGEISRKLKEKNHVPT